MIKKLLIVDDDKIFLKIFRDVLAKDYAGKYEVAVAENGIDALVKMESFHPDLIVLDIQMPQMDGIEFLRERKRRNLGVDTPVLISSNFADVDKISEGLELGVKGYVVKSDYSLDAIIKQVDSLLGVSPEEVG
ncbi:MAG: response regulator [Candidatus Pacebacteria bacterium]|nr:response regulator [Candidatus Paceibacterota bacterium]